MTTKYCGNCRLRCGDFANYGVGCVCNRWQSKQIKRKEIVEKLERIKLFVGLRSNTEVRNELYQLISDIKRKSNDGGEA